MSAVVTLTDAPDREAQAAIESGPRPPWSRFG
jgi:hypothetical protein